MKVSFDGLRKNLVAAYKKTIMQYHAIIEEYGPPSGIDSLTEMQEGLDDIRQMIAAVLCCYDSESIEKDNDFHDLADLADSLPFANPNDEFFESDEEDDEK
jgi:hypothetical protein